MKHTEKLFHCIQSYFQSYLSTHRGLSPNTVLSYRDVLKLFLAFCANHLHRSVARLQIEDLNANAALAFLQEIEEHRENCARTRNHRLAALRSFFHYLITQDPSRAQQYYRIINIPLKRASRPLLPYLEIREIQAIMENIDLKEPAGLRDHALLKFLYNTGARVQEIVDLNIGSVRLSSPPIATLIGKGGKTRQVPLWSDTTVILKDYLHKRGTTAEPHVPLFTNRFGLRLTRFGINYILRTRVAAAVPRCPILRDKRISPHTLRHTTAMHLLQSGVDLTIIQNWLGHAQLATTHGYVEIDLEMKRKALAACAPVATSKALNHLVRQNKDVIAWLESL